MENKMFCYQCEQTAGCTGCTGNTGVCGKSANTARLQDELTGALIGLARATEGNEQLVTEEMNQLVLEGLFTTITNVNFNDETLKLLIDKIEDTKKKLVPNCFTCSDSCGRNNNFDMSTLWTTDEDIRSLKSLILFGIRGMAAYAYHASVLGYTDETISKFFYKALFAIGMKDWGMDKLLPIVLEVGKVNLRCMELLDQANTTTYGTPVPTTVPLTIEKGPFIIITGHDLKDLQLLLEQTKDKGINIYTHGVSYPEIVHIGEEKDFTPVIEKALALGGYTKDQHMTGINGGIQVTTGFSHGTVLSVADQVIEAVKNGDIKHFFLVGGCDGARVGRNYYTEFVKQSPADSIILTLACGKYRFNDLDLGTIGGLPRIMDMGQCNDAYSAIKVAIALAEAFECDVNELPLSMVRAEGCMYFTYASLSWNKEHSHRTNITNIHFAKCAEFPGRELWAFSN